MLKTKVLESLKENRNYTSGQELCEKFGVSRTAIWKVINQLKEEGYEIDSVMNKGYKICSYPDILSKSEIESTFSKSEMINKVVFFEETDSTNIRAKILGEEGCESGTLVVADYQSSGRGRRGKEFESPKGESIYMTILLRPDLSPTKASMLTILTAMAVTKGIEESCGLKADIKWPNDIVYDNKKLCGILVEMSTERDFINYVVVGVGINVNNSIVSDALKDVATSIKMSTSKEQKRSVIMLNVINTFEKYYNEFMRVGDLSFVKDEYNKSLIHYDKSIVIIQGKEKFEAISKGIDDDGELIIEKDGKTSKVISGEVSVRGVYGYV